MFIRQVLLRPVSMDNDRLSRTWSHKRRNISLHTWEGSQCKTNLSATLVGAHVHPAGAPAAGEHG